MLPEEGSKPGHNLLSGSHGAHEMPVSDSESVLLPAGVNNQSEPSSLDVFKAANFAMPWLDAQLKPLNNNISNNLISTYRPREQMIWSEQTGEAMPADPYVDLTRATTVPQFEINSTANDHEAHVSGDTNIDMLEIDWSDVFHLPSSSPPSVMSAGWSQMADSTQLSSIQGNVVEAFSTSTSSGCQDSNRRHQALSPFNYADGYDFDKVVRDSHEPEILVGPVQFIKSHLSQCLDPSSTEWNICCGTALGDLFDIIHSQWLQLELEDLLCRTWESCLKAVRDQQAARSEYEAGDHSIGLSSKQTIRNGPGPSHESPMQHNPLALNLRYSNYLLSVAPAGVLKVQLGKYSELNDPRSGGPSQCVVRVSSTSVSKKRTVGVSVTFRKPLSHSTQLRLYPHIETFNVVPHDSEIIKCVSRSDLQGVRRLFDAREASAMDVDPFGFSLLSVKCPYLRRSKQF